MQRRQTTGLAREEEVGVTWAGGVVGGMGMGMGGMDISQTETEPRMMGILTVAVIDVKKKALVWRGQASTDAISNSQKGDEKQVLKSVDKMFKQFPPNKQK